MNKSFLYLLCTSLLLGFSFQASAKASRAVTLWWVVFNQPQNCITAPQAFERCGAPDVFGQAYLDSLAAGQPDPTLISPNFAADIGVIYATGATTDARGRVRMAASIYRTNPADIPLDITNSSSIVDPLGLGNAWTNVLAEVHLVVRDHGRVVRDDVVTQLTGFLEPNCSDPTLGFVAGPNVCRDIQDALFAPEASGESEVGSLVTGHHVPGARAILLRNGDSLQAIIETIVTEAG